MLILLVCHCIYLAFLSAAFTVNAFYPKDSTLAAADMQEYAVKALVVTAILLSWTLANTVALLQSGKV